MSITIHDLRLESTTYGSIYSRYVEVEGESIDFDGYDPVKKVTYKDLPKHPVDDTLEVLLRCRGINGASCKLTVFSDGKKLDPEINCVVEGGACGKTISYGV